MDTITHWICILEVTGLQAILAMFLTIFLSLSAHWSKPQCPYKSLLTFNILLTLVSDITPRTTSSTDVKAVYESII
jgi:hypothetical protein